MTEETEKPRRSIVFGGIVPHPGGVEEDKTAQVLVPPEVIEKRNAEENKLLAEIRRLLDQEGIFHNIPQEEDCDHSEVELGK